jgi:hypothetical protein
MEKFKVKESDGYFLIDCDSSNTFGDCDNCKIKKYSEKILLKNNETIDDKTINECLYIALKLLNNKPLNSSNCYMLYIHMLKEENMKKKIKIWQKLK